MASYLHDQELIERIQLQLTKAIEEKNRDILEKSYDKHEVLLKNRDLIEQTRHIKIRQKERIKEKQRRNYKKVIENHVLYRYIYIYYLFYIYIYIYSNDLNRTC